jgi:hypothetical protein
VRPSGSSNSVALDFKLARGWTKQLAFSLIAYRHPSVKRQKVEDGAYFHLCDRVQVLPRREDTSVNQAPHQGGRQITATHLHCRVLRQRRWDTQSASDWLVCLSATVVRSTTEYSQDAIHTHTERVGQRVSFIHWNHARQALANIYHNPHWFGPCSESTAQATSP